MCSMNEDTNPYKVVVKKRRKRFKADAVGTAPVETYNLETGEVRSAIQLVGNNKFYDVTDFIKLYNPAILIGMSCEAVAVFAYIMNNLLFEGYVIFRYEDCMAYTKYHSRQSVYRGLMELKNRDVVRQKGRGEWWVNPNIVYRGQRDEI